MVKERERKSSRKESNPVYIHRSIQCRGGGYRQREKVCRDVTADRVRLALACHESRKALFRLTIESQGIRRQVLRKCQCIKTCSLLGLVNTPVRKYANRWLLRLIALITMVNLEWE